MKCTLFLALALVVSQAQSQVSQNIILVTTDGFRWQDLFRGMDSAIANNSKWNQGDSAGIFLKYWSADESERRQKLLPFFWKTLAPQGQVYGNRDLGCMVNNANPHWFSYPGYNELLTGYPDSAINSNDYPPNPHESFLAFMQKQPGFSGRVAAFGAWEAFNRILNEEKCGFPVIAAFDATGGAKPTSAEKLINKMNAEAYRPFGDEECLDVFTHAAAMDYLKTKKPRVLYISYGETDEWAHGGRYKSYLDAAHQVDAWLAEIWNFVQSDPQYKGKTTILITTDHGRGDIKKEEWTSHYDKIADSYQIWFAAMGPGIEKKGEINQNMVLFQAQLAQTMARLMGKFFVSNHPVTAGIPYLFNKTE